MSSEPPYVLSACWLDITITVSPPPPKASSRVPSTSSDTSAPAAHPCNIPAGAFATPTNVYEADMLYLKEKVDAGAELIVAHLFFNVDVFLRFVKYCRRVGITCPVVLGILPIMTYRNIKYTTETCRRMVSAEVRAVWEDEVALGAYGVALATEMCRRIVESGVWELHFYMMNREGPSVAVLQNLGSVGGGEKTNKVSRLLGVEQEDVNVEKKACKDCSASAGDNLLLSWLKRSKSGEKDLKYLHWSIW